MELLKLFPKDNLTLFRQDKIIKIANRLSLALLILNWLLLVFFWQKLPPQIPLFYSLPWGEEQLGSPILLLLLLFLTLLLGILNSFAAIFCFKKHLLATQVLVWMTTFFIFLMTITTVKIIFLLN